MSAHTPGPWAIRPNSGTEVNAGKKHIAMVNFFKTHDDAESVYGEEHDANARLIAAAPDLLLAAQEAMRLIELLAILAQDGKEIYKHELRGDVELFTRRIAPAIDKAIGESK